MKTILTFALTVCALSASPIYTTTATLTGVNGASVGNSYASPYYLTLGQSPLQVYCDDFLDESVIGETWTANIFSGTDLAGTYFSLTDPDYITDYARVFWLVDQSASGAVDAVAAQQAIWSALDPAYAGSAASADLLAASVGHVVDPSRFIVIDGVDAGSGRIQEFVADPPSDAPEPGTLGLAMVTILMWRKRREQSLEA